MGKELKRGIVPRKIKGFRDIDSATNAVRWKIVNAASEVCRKYGFEQRDTPVVEYSDCLGKYLPDRDTTEEGVYSFKNPEIEPVLDEMGREMRDHGNNVIMENHFVSLRYDLTAPLARVYAEGLWQQKKTGSMPQKNFPLFRRFQFGPVYRFEAKLDPGRYREFWQFDFDTVGTSSIVADSEVCLIYRDIFEKIGIKQGQYIIKVNNRKILTGFLNSLNVNERNNVNNRNNVDERNAEHDLLRVIDKYDKIGIHGVLAELGVGRKDAQSGAFIEGLQLASDTIQKIEKFLTRFNKEEKREKTIEFLKEFFKDFINSNHESSKLLADGIRELEQVHTMLDTLGVGSDVVTFSPTLVRGMAYYTGIVFEVEAKIEYRDKKGKKRGFGAICGGGRYDGLVKRLLGIEVPATGASIGVDRLAELLSVVGFDTKEQSKILIILFSDNYMIKYQQLAKMLRDVGFAVEIYYGMKRSLKHQLAYADKSGHSFAIMLGEDEIAQNVVTVRNLKAGAQLSENIKDKQKWKKAAQETVPIDGLIDYLKAALEAMG